MFTSKRFWVAVAAIATTIGLMFGGEITTLQGLTAIIATVITLIGADSLRKLGT